MRPIWQLVSFGLAIEPFYWALEFYCAAGFVQVAIGPLRINAGWPRVGPVADPKS